MSRVPALWWGSPELAPRYRAEVLHGADRARAAHARSPRAERDWRVSRVLLAQARAAWQDEPPPALSLSHSHGHAVVGAAPAGWRIGVDLERIRPRRVDELARWCCGPDEQAVLAGMRDERRRLQAFYALWTLKEAFIKAANLDFPADMRSVGLAWDAPETALAHARLRAPGPGWRAWSARVDDAWAVSAVWWTGDAAEGQAIPSLWAARGIVAPEVFNAGRWC
ncbi:4'-phosphopantetheinyl transferase family protein [Bordetella bronchialis]|uniref:4'-phosphopantetheinyl transferase domain-containing protein n=1 Tax=Bordetella bronchialis TaxID=463025 RepID=A0A193FVL0_9BORD|nr:4'-phosphopantetheinyl transferase superfamily protein [Bordetella bronchialis]ANN71675.1 hypothetical protein BAU08_10310 [Bordetella bronchialis]